MKKIFFAFAIIGLLSCSQKSFEIDSSNFKTVFVIDIDKTSLSNYYLVTCTDDKSSDKLIILSKKPSNEIICKHELLTQNKYKLELVNQKRVELDVAYNLNVSNIYVEGKLVFPKEYLVYSSPALSGLCIK